LSSTLYSSASFAATETNHAQSKLTLNMISLWLPEFQPERGRSCALLMMYNKVIAARLPKLSPPASTRRFLQLHSAYIFIRRLNKLPEILPYCDRPTFRIMRLLQFDDDGKLSLTEFFESAIPNYAILSHRWGTDEVTFKGLTDGTSKSKASGYSKI
jgi:hypothetical protein